MGFMFIILLSVVVSYIWFCLLTLVTTRFYKSSERLNKYTARLKGQLIWGSSMTFVQEGYLDLMLAVCLWFRAESSWSLSGNRMDWFLGVIFTAGVIVYPIVGLIFLCINKARF